MSPSTGEGKEERNAETKAEQCDCTCTVYNQWTGLLAEKASQHANTDDNCYDMKGTVILKGQMSISNTCYAVTSHNIIHYLYIFYNIWHKWYWLNNFKELITALYCISTLIYCPMPNPIILLPSILVHCQCTHGTCTYKSLAKVWPWVAASPCPSSKAPYTPNWHQRTRPDGTSAHVASRLCVLAMFRTGTHRKDFSRRPSSTYELRMREWQ